MASNRLPDGYDQLLFLAGRAQEGATRHGAEIPLLINTAALISADRTACLHAQGEYQTALSSLPGLFGDMKAVRANARPFCTKARDWLKNFLGAHHNEQWRAAGWKRNSIAIPERDADLAVLLELLEKYFEDHPEQECAVLNVTAARAGELLAAFNTAEQAVNTAKSHIETKREARNEAVEAIRARLRGLRGELQQRLAAADPRWLAFGFNIPAEPTLPAVPQAVVVDTHTPGELFIRCPASAHATYYRFFTQKPAVDAEPQFVGRSAEPMFRLKGVTPGQSLNVFVSAANERAESRLSKGVVASVSVARTTVPVAAGIGAAP